MLTIDQDKCKKDGFCAKACVAKIITRPTETEFPKINPDDEKFCIQCGHCVAVCPHLALDHKLAPLSQCITFEDDIFPTPEATEALLLSRRSIRNYQKKPVERDLVERLMNMGRIAPTGGNIENVRYTACDDPEKLKLLVTLVIDSIKKKLELGEMGDQAESMKRIIAAWDLGHDRILRHAPLIIAAHGNRINPGTVVNCALAMSFVDVMAYAMGLGACYAGFMNTAINTVDSVREAMGIPEDHIAGATLMIGYPVLTYKRVPPRKSLKMRWV